jgi:hypothetical protein
VAEHSIELDHWIMFHETEVLAKTSGHMGGLVKEATEIKLHPDNINREEGFKVSKAWNPRTRLLRHSSTHAPQKSQEDTEKGMLTRKNTDIRDSRASNMVIG